MSETFNTPALDRLDWPSVNSFHSPKTILKWRDIATGIYKILEVLYRGNNEYGRSLVLKLEHEDRSIVSVWAPSSVIFAIEQNSDVEYIVNNGLQPSKHGNMYFDFKIY